MHERLQVSLHEIETHWSIDDLADAHDMIGYIGRLTDWHRTVAEKEHKRRHGSFT